MNKCIPEISADTVMVYERLTKMAVGETISYAELDNVIGRILPPGMLRTARKKAQNDNNMIFGTIWGEGLKRLADSEIVNGAAASFSHIQRSAKREARRLSAVAFESLPQNLKIKHSASAAALAVIHEVASPKQARVIEARVGDGTQKLSMMQAIDAIRESEGGL